MLEAFRALSLGFTMLFETVIKPQRECGKTFFGRRLLNYNLEFKVCSTNAREKYYKTNTLRGGGKPGGTKAKRVDENTGFANLQLFTKTHILIYNHSHTHFLTRKEDPELVHFITKPKPESH